MGKRKKAPRESKPTGLEGFQHLRSSHIAGGLGLLVLLVYVNSFGNEFTDWDDRVLSINNPQVVSFDLLDTFRPVPGETYQPIRVLSYAIDYALWGERPLGYHVVNTLLHAIATIFLFLCMIRLLDDLRPKTEANNRAVALLVALLFALHPVNVEAVTWISSRKYGLLAAFSFLALFCHFRNSQKGMSAAAGAASLLAMLSSPFGIVLPALFVLIDYCRRREFRKCWRPYVPIAIATVLAVPPILLGLFGDGGASMGDESQGHFAVLTTLAVLWRYAVNLMLPLALNNRYENVAPQSLLEGPVLLGLLGILVVFVAVAKRWRAGDRLPLLCFGWFCIAWLPVSNLVATSTTMADRYLYLPAVGVFLAVAMLVDRAIARWPAARLQIWGCMALVLVGLAALSCQRNKVWKSSLTLWADCLAKGGEHSIAHYSYGRALQKAGDLDSAIAHLERSLEQNEMQAKPHQVLGVCYIKKQKWEEAIPHLRRSLELMENYPAAWSNLGMCLLETGEPAEAAKCFRRASQHDPSNVSYRLNEGVALLKLGQASEAETVFGSAFELKPGIVLARQIAGALSGAQQYGLALPYLHRAQTMAPNDPGIKVAYGRCLLRGGRASEAVLYLEAAVKQFPDSAALVTLLTNAKAQSAQE